MDTNETRAAAATSTGTSQPAQSSNGTERRPSSPKQISTLFDWYMVPKDITVLLTGGMGGEASRLYDYVKAKKAEVGDDTYKSNANYYIKAALEYINKEVAAKVPAGVALAESDGFDDPD
jgi:triacylglycerol esterase/lipase EstA (alpha/beta hydrolase family)